MEWLIFLAVLTFCSAIGGGVIWFVKGLDADRYAEKAAENKQLKADIEQQRKEAHAKKQIDATRPLSSRDAVKRMRKTGKIK